MPPDNYSYQARDFLVTKRQFWPIFLPNAKKSNPNNNLQEGLLNEPKRDSAADTPPKRRRWVPWWLPALAAAGSTFLLVVIALHDVRWGSMWAFENVGEWGQFGDFVGGVANPFMSFLTLIAVLVIPLTMFLHRREGHE